MKRIKVATGKFVMISSELAEKAARIRMLTKAQADALAALEPKATTGPMLGSKLRHRRKPELG